VQRLTLLVVGHLGEMSEIPRYPEEYKVSVVDKCSYASKSKRFGFKGV